MLLHEVTATSAAVAATSSRLEKIARLASLLAALPPGDVRVAVAFLSGTIRQGRIGIGGARLGRLDAVPAEAPALTMADVDAAFEDIAAARGAGSVQTRLDRLRALLSRATADEQRFLVRLLTGELRQGALEGVLVEAVAQAAGAPAAAVRRAAMLTGDLGQVAADALAGGAGALDRHRVEVLRPVDPMLADSAASVDEALGRLGHATFEWKLDGARIQAHKRGDEVRVYSRNLRDVSTAVPEVCDLLRGLPASRVILDGEVLALRQDGTPQPFQVTMRRFGRRLDIARLQQDVPVTPYFFDCLLRDEDVLIDEPQAHRFAALTEVAPASTIVPHTTTADPREAQAFLDRALAHGHEGVMAKAPDAPYASGRRGQAWLKIKPARTLDLVVLAAEWGHGRRRGWLSNLHLGARDEAGGGFVMLGKTFKGLTDAMLEWQTGQLLALETRRDRYTVYVRPELVVEVAFNELQQSPRYPGGLALRFARVKGYRPDRTAGDADTFAAVQAIYQRQTGLEPPGGRLRWPEDGG